MLAGAGVRHSCAFARISLSRSSFAQRQFSSLNARTFTQSRSGLARQHGVSLSTIRFPRSIAPFKSSRFASTSAVSSAAASTPSDPASATTPESVVPGLDELSGASLTDFDLSKIPKELGYLRELGLDYGYGPSSMIEFVLESMHIYAGLPWWGAALATAALIRLALFKYIVAASEQSSKTQAIKHIADPIRQRMMNCAREKDATGMTQAKQELAALNAAHGIKIYKAFIPLLQVPLGFGCFRVLSGMSQLPVPGLETESFAWLPSVIGSDPYYILPLATGAMTYLALKRGGDTGMSTLTSTSLGKMVLYGIPAIAMVSMTFWSGLVQIYFLATGFFSMSQAYLVTSPTFRNFAGLGPIPKRPDDSSNQPPSKIRTITTTATLVPEPEIHVPKPNISYIDRVMDSTKTGLRNTLKEAQEKMKTLSGDDEKPDSAGRQPRLNKKELESAKAYESRRRAELLAERELKNQQLRAQFRKKAESKE